MNYISIVGAVILLECPPGAHADIEPLTPDAAAFSLWNPVPRDQMRRLSTDRPDATESPFTVDARHYQVEFSFVDYSRDNEGNVRTLDIAPLLLKAGLTPSIDFQVGLTPYTSQRSESGTSRETVDGFGDTIVRVKINLHGNDTGESALAIMPFIKIPTASDGLGNDDLEAGIIVPAAFELAHGFNLGAMLEFDVVRNEADDAYTLDLVHTATIARGLTDTLGLFVEYAGAADTSGESSYRASLNTGMTLGISPDIQLDAGVRIGLTGAAEDLGIFAGMAWRY
ncbi:MAG: transporter [Phycisphaerales bacterium]|nr:MAG: transporter [Phycisphaerales bacterium]